MLNRKLIVVQQYYQQAHTLLQVLNGYEVAFSEKIDEKRGRWIEGQRYQAVKKMEENDWAAQWKIKVEKGWKGR